MTVRIGFKASPQDVDWAMIDATWREAGALTTEPGGGFDSGWLNDHRTNMDATVPGPSLETLTVLVVGMPAALGPTGLREVARECLAPLRDHAA